MKISKITNKQYETIFNFGKRVHDGYLKDTGMPHEAVEAWIKRVYQNAAKPAPVIKITVNPYLIPPFLPDPDIALKTLHNQVRKRGRIYKP